MSKPADERREEWENLTPRQRVERKRGQAKALIDHPDFNSSLVKRAQKRMARVDAMPPELRAIVYKYNLEIVQEFLSHGVKKPSSIEHLIDTVLANDHKNGQPRFKLNKSPNAKRNPADEEEEYWSAT